MQLEAVGCAYGGPAAFVEAVVVEAAQEREVGQFVSTAVGSMADVVHLEVAAAAAAGNLAAVFVALFF